MIKNEKNMVVMDVEGDLQLMQEFVNITRAVHATLTTQGKKTEEEATVMVLDAVGFALDIDWNEDDDEEPAAEQQEAPEVPKNLEDAIRRIVKEVYDEEPKEDGETPDAIVEITLPTPDELLKGLNMFSAGIKKEGEK